MIRIFFPMVLAFLSPVIGTCQVKQKVKFSSVNTVGLLAGARGEALLAQTINGIKIKNNFVGAGVGLDFYGDRTVPLFVGYRRELTAGTNIPFVYADAGANFLWLNFIQHEQKGFPDASPGYYYELGAGLKLNGKNNRGFILSAGYTLKQVRYKTRSFQIAPTPTQSPADNHYHFLYRRLVIKIGFQF